MSARSSHAEVERLGVMAAEVGDQRVVGVEHEPRAAAVGRDDRGPAVGDRLELAVAVELVAEQVREQHRARLRAPRSPGRARTRRPRRARDRRTARARRAARRPPARTRRRPPCWPRRGCGRAACPCAPARRRPSPRSSSCRWSPRSRRCRASAGRRAARSRAARGGSGPCRGARSRRRGPARRASVPTALAATSLRREERASGKDDVHAGASTSSSPGCTRTVAGSSATGSPSA